jgi:hypothetical protein
MPLSLTRMLGLHYLTARFDLDGGNFDSRLLSLLERALESLTRVPITGPWPIFNSVYPFWCDPAGALLSTGPMPRLQA